ncbi:MAG: hypothetical protein IPO05_11020 [Flavobacteriales bacterium]|jgi:hypothetical protein|nr:hypothetical protein [Flavobacteriales bacterium]MBK9514133.1 hypothetical protein [Flavobacteriales bacterium]MBP7449492.1 hypothetical protein [Flavobacteriales bacterium]
MDQVLERKHPPDVLDVEAIPVFEFSIVPLGPDQEQAILARSSGRIDEGLGEPIHPTFRGLGLVDPIGEEKEPATGVSRNGQFLEPSSKHQHKYLPM